VRPHKRLLVSIFFYRFLCRNLTSSVPRLQKKLYGTTDAGFFGYSHFTGGFPGGQAEYVRVPKGQSPDDTYRPAACILTVNAAGNVNLLPIPDDVMDEAALYLSDILPTSYHSVVDTGVEKGDTVAIWGLGPIGQCAAKWAQLKGASKVIGIDAVPFRLEHAEKMLGIQTINFKEHTDVPKRIRELVGEKGVDVALDCGLWLFLHFSNWKLTIGQERSTSRRRSLTKSRSS